MALTSAPFCSNWVRERFFRERKHCTVSTPDGVMRVLVLMLLRPPTVAACCPSARCWRNCLVWFDSWPWAKLTAEINKLNDNNRLFFILVLKK